MMSLSLAWAVELVDNSHSGSWPQGCNKTKGEQQVAEIALIFGCWLGSFDAYDRSNVTDIR
jgi:hypothetical protein